MELIHYSSREAAHMRTTLDIDDSVLAAIKELAQREGKSAGAVLSELARRALTMSTASQRGGVEGGGVEGGKKEAPALYGFKPFAGKELVTNALVDKLRDEQGV